jgi:hypothetical protein
MAHTEHLQAVMDALTAGLTEALGENLYSLVLYGDDVRGDPAPDPTDLGALIILNELTSNALAAIADAIRGRIRSDPFIVTRREIEQSLRTFALKLRGISRRHKVLAGVDPFEAFELDPETLRFLIDHSRRDLRARAARPAGHVGYRTNGCSTRERTFALAGQTTAVGQDQSSERFGRMSASSRTAVVPLMKMLRPARMAAMRKLHCSIDLCREGRVWAVCDQCCTKHISTLRAESRRSLHLLGQRSSSPMRALAQALSHTP